MTNIKHDLGELVLAQEQQAHEDQLTEQQRHAIQEALVETTSLSASQVSSVLAELTQETSEKKHTENSFLKIPAIKNEHLRIALYAILGLLAFSYYKASEVGALNAEQHYMNPAQHTKVEFQVSTIRLIGFLGSPYHAYFKEHSAFPKDIADLDSHYRVADLMKSSSYISDYSVLEDGRIKLVLSESLGYNRWMILTPKTVKKPLSSSVGFDCKTNAEKHLLTTTSGNWCKHVAR